jgi:hypothetical protein
MPRTPPRKYRGGNSSAQARVAISTGGSETKPDPKAPSPETASEFAKTEFFDFLVRREVNEYLSELRKYAAILSILAAPIAFCLGYLGISSANDLRTRIHNLNETERNLSEVQHSLSRRDLDLKKEEESIKADAKLQTAATQQSLLTQTQMLKEEGSLLQTSLSRMSAIEGEIHGFKTAARDSADSANSSARQASQSNTVLDSARTNLEAAQAASKKATEDLRHKDAQLAKVSDVYYNETKMILGAQHATVVLNSNEKRTIELLDSDPKKFDPLQTAETISEDKSAEPSKYTLTFQSEQADRKSQFYISVQKNDKLQGCGVYPMYDPEKDPPRADDGQIIPTVINQADSKFSYTIVFLYHRKGGSRFGSHRFFILSITPKTASDRDIKPDKCGALPKRKY